MFYIMSTIFKDVNGNHVSPDRYTLTHTKGYLSLTSARKNALKDPTFSMYRQCIYKGDTDYAKLVGIAYKELKGKDIYHYTSANVWKDLKGRMWYLNQNGTLGKRYYKKG